MLMNESCKDCLLNKNLNSYPKDISEETIKDYQNAVIEAVNEGIHYSAPEVVGRISKIYESHFGKKKDYTEIKYHFNELMMELYPSMKQRTEEAEDPLYAALQYAMTGNFIDFAALDSVDENKLRGFLEEAHSIDINKDVYESFRKDITTKTKLVLFTDNCGEIVTDKLLLSVIRTLNPYMNITVIVRGQPVVNDATMEDAKQIHMEEEANLIIGNGSHIAGNVLTCLSVEALNIVNNADILISKGQGNYESLAGCNLNVYYLFMCKCALFMNRFHVPQFTGIMAKEL